MTINYKSRKSRSTSKPRKVNKRSKSRKSRKVSKSKKANKSRKVSKSRKGSKPRKVSKSRSNSKPKKVKKSRKGSKPRKVSKSRSNSKPKKVKKSRKVSNPKKNFRKMSGGGVDDYGYITPYTIFTIRDAVQQLLDSNTALTALEITSKLDVAGVEEVVKAAAENRVTPLRSLRIDFNHNLTAIPANIDRLTDLQELWLHQNEISRVPAELGSLEVLRVLNLGGNRLQMLPTELGKLTDLMQLHLYHNLLTTLPATFSKLTSLVDLGLSDNRLYDQCAIPLRAMLTGDNALIKLNLYNNNISDQGCRDVAEILETNPDLYLNLGGNTGYASVKNILLEKEQRSGEAGWDHQRNLAVRRAVSDKLEAARDAVDAVGNVPAARDDAYGGV